MARPRHKAESFTPARSRLPNQLYRQAQGAAAPALLLQRFERNGIALVFSQEFPSAAQLSSVTHAHCSFSSSLALRDRETHRSDKDKETDPAR